ncbi:hypothetical protein Y032_0578g233 [Ancylostoma ceylanicum]|uniref:Uncharacterized protein n=1 Tax=Ancylostoma ceylanicum TaxID=53326 RepID=A0A016WNM4_9BILA|nr:hypothetical protein Y032_0578g233 [Ancylostoma ceylanicum]
MLLVICGYIDDCITIYSENRADKPFQLLKEPSKLTIRGVNGYEYIREMIMLVYTEEYLLRNDFPLFRSA